VSCRVVSWRGVVESWSRGVVESWRRGVVASWSRGVAWRAQLVACGVESWSRGVFHAIIATDNL